jgi:two-component system sensor histidine kinase KdpD
VSLCTVVSAVLAPYIGLGNVDALYLLAVVLVAARHGRGPAILTSTLGVLAFDCFIVPPTFGFVPEDATYMITFAVMLFVALTVSALAAALREQMEIARDRLAKTMNLYDLAADLASAGDAKAVARVVREHVQQVFQSPAAVLMPRGARMAPVETEGSLELGGEDLAAAATAYSTHEHVGRGCTSDAGSAMLHLPLLTSKSAIGVLALAPTPADRFSIAGERRHLGAFADQAALAFERAQLAEATRTAELEIEQERLRNTLLHSVSHDLRTPVAAIHGAASALLQSERIDVTTRTELLQSICSASDLLGRRVHDLLEVSRLEAGAVQAMLEWTPIDEVVGSALAALEPALRQREVVVDLPPDLPPVPLDGMLVQHLLMNLVENAVRHAPSGPIEIVARAELQEVVVDVLDRGPGVPAGEQERVFAKFYRPPGPAGRAGTGLGLAIAKAIVQLHNGRIWVEPRSGGGAVFRVAFPRNPPGGPDLPGEPETGAAG